MIGKYAGDIDFEVARTLRELRERAISNINRRNEGRDYHGKDGTKGCDIRSQGSRAKEAHCDRGAGAL